MRRRAIAFVPRKLVAGMARIHFDHDAITRDLCDDAGRGDAEAQPIAADERGLRIRKWAHRPAVDEHVTRREPKQGDGAAHRFVSGLQDVEPIDILAPDDGHRPHHVGTACECAVKIFPLRWREFLRVVEHLVAEARWQDHRRRHHRPSERAAARFINAGDE